MVEITNVKVYDLTESVIASRNAMRLTPADYTAEEFEASLKRATTLAHAKSGSGHDNWLKGVRVSFDIKYPQYFTPELQRYNFMDIVTSASKMHRLVKMDLDMACNEYVSRQPINEMKSHISLYNFINEIEEEDFKPMEFNLRDGSKIVASKKEDALYYAFMLCISNCPMGLELFMRCSTNYLQLKTIYKQRKGHKLKEDWGAFLAFIRELPYTKEFIIGE